MKESAFMQDLLEEGVPVRDHRPVAIVMECTWSCNARPEAGQKFQVSGTQVCRYLGMYLGRYLPTRYLTYAKRYPCAWAWGT